MGGWEEREEKEEKKKEEKEEKEQKEQKEEKEEKEEKEQKEQKEQKRKKPNEQTKHIRSVPDCACLSLSLSFSLFPPLPPSYQRGHDFVDVVVHDATGGF